MRKILVTYNPLLCITILSFLSICSFSQQGVKYSCGTTILTFITPDTIWIASDTKVLNVSTPTRDTTFSKGTKIFKSGDRYYGFCGLNNLSGFNSFSFEPKNIMDSLLMTEKTLRETYDVFDSVISPKIKDLVDWLYRYSYSEYEKYSGKLLFQYLVLGFENNKPHYFTLGYEIDSTLFSSRGIKKAKREVYTNGTVLFLSGFSAEIRELITKKEFIVDILNIRNQLPCLIKKEASLHKDEVGMPVDEYIIDKKHYSFLKDLNCVIP